MYDEKKVEKIKKSVVKFIEDHENYPSTDEMQSFLDIRSQYALIAVYELVIKNTIFYDPNNDHWMLLGPPPEGAVSISKDVCEACKGSGTVLKENYQGRVIGEEPCSWCGGSGKSVN